jgi:hypothetical protein
MISLLMLESRRGGTISLEYIPSRFGMHDLPLEIGWTESREEGVTL